MGFVVALFMVLALGAPAFGLMTLQFGLAIQGILFCGLFLTVGWGLGTLRREVEDVQDQLDDATPTKRKDATSDFSAAMAAYQKHNGQSDAAAAIRTLAAEALRQQGFLR